MSSRDVAAGSPAEPVSAKPVMTPMAILGAISVTVLLAGQIAVAVAAFVWSVSGLLHLPLLAVEVLAVLLAIPTMWITYRIAKMAWQAETDPQNN